MAQTSAQRFPDAGDAEMATARLAALGGALLAVAVVASGVMQIVNGEFVRLVTIPTWLPWPRAWAIAAGVAAMVLGAAMFSRTLARPAAATLGGLLLASFAVRVATEVAADPWTGFRWTNPLKVLGFCGGLLLFAGGGGWAGRWPFLPAALFGVFLGVCGVQHFVYADFVDTLVPAWIPPTQRFWTQVTGVALIAGGVGVLVPRVARLAAACSGVMIFLWVLLLHVPRAWGLGTAFELAGVFEALGMSGIAFMLAGRAGSNPPHSA